MAPDGNAELAADESVPKYLELLCDPASSLENEGYEIPNQMVNETLEHKKFEKTPLRASLNITIKQNK